MRIGKMMLVIAVCMCLFAAVSTRRYTKQSERLYRSRESECKRSDTCTAITDVDEKMDCARRCMSADCHATYYIDYEFEDGEVDTRAQQFKACAVQSQQEDEDDRCNNPDASETPTSSE
eukprot:TRINITY_DN4965_c0_g1_i1.p1 TRINITY_DN4965_c0_g1~~TRINITY_DN4965_c0_g1_i1.p1  ORF type:complete len:119 (-),score=23.27 TRINITY_DN4965_c0_g1_i1:62-418(-)